MNPGGNALTLEPGLQLVALRHANDVQVINMLVARTFDRGDYVYSLEQLVVAFSMAPPIIPLL